MLIKTLLNHVQPFKGFVYKNAKLTKSYDRFEWEEDRLVVEIAPRKNSKGVCYGCGVKGPGYDKLPIRLYDYLPILGILVYFAYQPRRVECPECKVKVEKLPWSDGKNQLTNTLQWFLSS